MMNAHNDVHSALVPALDLVWIMILKVTQPQQHDLSNGKTILPLQSTCDFYMRVLTGIDTSLMRQVL